MAGDAEAATAYWGRINTSRDNASEGAQGKRPSTGAARNGGLPEHRHEEFQCAPRILMKALRDLAEEQGACVRSHG